MRRFTVNILLFSLPVLFLLSVPASVFWKTKESFISEAQLKNVVKSGDYLIGYLYNESNYRAVKKIAIESGPPAEVMILGSSRVTQFRDFMFDKPFFNAGYTIVTINQFQEYLESMPAEKLPKILVIGLDHWMFNPSWDLVENPIETDFFSSQIVSVNQEPKPRQIESFWRDALSGKFNLFGEKPHYSSEVKQVVGLNAHFFGMGFRQDGSFSYGAKAIGRIKNDPAIQDFGFQDTFERIEKGVVRFEYGSEINPRALQRLRSLIDFCHSKKIKLVTFLPPFAPAVVKKMNESGNHSYIFKLPEEIKKVVQAESAEFWDFTDVSSLKVEDDAFIDGFHGGEYCYLKIVEYMARHHSALQESVDLEGLEKLASESKNILEVL